MPEYLFVCGTLLPELVPGHLAGLLRSLTAVGEAYVSGLLYDLGEYPGAIIDESAKTRVRGRVFQLPPDPAVIQALDDYECVDPNDIAGSLFVRTQVNASLANGESLLCWIYVFNGDVTGKPLVPNGDYLEYVSMDSPGE